MGRCGGPSAQLWGGVWGLTDVGVVQDLHDSHLPEKLLREFWGAVSAAPVCVPKSVTTPTRGPPLTFCRLEELSCVLSMIFTATWEGRDGSGNVVEIVPTRR